MEKTAEFLTAEFLKDTRVFNSLPIESIETYIVPKGIVKAYPKECVLFWTQQRVDNLMVLISGKVNTLYYYADGSYSLAGTILPSRVLGLDLIATRTRISPYNAVAAEDSVVFMLPADIVLKAGELPETYRQQILSQLIVLLSHSQLQKEKHLMALSRNGLRERIMTYLSLQAQQKKSASFTIPFSREEMAAYLCVNRSALSHELGRMQKEGLITFRKNRFTLLQYEQTVL